MDLKDKIANLDSDIEFMTNDHDLVAINRVAVRNHQQDICLRDYHLGRYILDDGGDLFASTYNVFADRLNRVQSENPKAEILKKFDREGDVVWGMSCFLAGEKLKELCESASNKKVTYFYSFKFRKYNKFVCVLKSKDVKDLVGAIHEFVELRSKAFQACKETANAIIDNAEVFEKYFEKIKQNALSQSVAHDKQGNYDLMRARYYSDKKMAKKGLRQINAFEITTIFTPALLVMLATLVIPNIVLYLFPQAGIQVLSYQLAVMLTLFLFYLNHHKPKKPKLNITVTVTKKKDKKDK